MLEDDIYVNQFSLGIDSVYGMTEHMRRTLSFEGKGLREAVLVLCAYCFYLSQEELSLLYPVYPAFTQLSSRVFKPLIDLGYIVSEPAQKQNECEGTCKTFYSITKSGYEYANSLCNGKLTVKYRKNRTRIAKSHSYYIGYNLIEILLLGYAVTWQREYLLSSSFSLGKKMLQVDARCDLYEAFGQHPFYTIYVEQDLGTEGNSVLFNKMMTYADLSLMNHPKDSLVLFSFSPKGVSLKNNPSSSDLGHLYSRTRLKALLSYMDMMHLDDAYEAYITGFPDREFVMLFLLTTSAAKENSNGPLLKRGPFKADRAFIEEFLLLINQRRNPYQQRDYNYVRCNLTRSRMEEMVRLIFRHASDNSRFFISMRDGFQILYLPTTLVANRLPYAFLSHSKDTLSALMMSLGYFGNLRFVSDVSDTPLVLDRSVQISLRNMFLTGDQKRIFVEFPALDIGAWLRALHFSSLYHASEPITLICVFETEKQLSDFYRACEAYMRTYSIERGGILCLMLSDIGRTDRLFYCKDNSLARTYPKGEN